MYRKPLAVLCLLAAALSAGGAPRAAAVRWYWANGAKCQPSDHPPAFELAQTRTLGGRLVEDKTGRTEIVLPSLEAYQPLRQKGFHFIFFKTEQACAAFLQEEARRKAEQDRAYQEYRKELQPKQ